MCSSPWTLIVPCFASQAFLAMERCMGLLAAMYFLFSSAGHDSCLGTDDHANKHQKTSNTLNMWKIVELWGKSGHGLVQAVLSHASLAAARAARAARARRPVDRQPQRRSEASLGKYTLYVYLFQEPLFRPWASWAPGQRRIVAMAEISRASVVISCCDFQDCCAKVFLKILLSQVDWHAGSSQALSRRFCRCLCGNGMSLWDAMGLWGHMDVTWFHYAKNTILNARWPSGCFSTHQLLF